MARQVPIRLKPQTFTNTTTTTQTNSRPTTKTKPRSKFSLRRPTSPSCPLHRYGSRRPRFHHFHPLLHRKTPRRMSSPHPVGSSLFYPSQRHLTNTCFVLVWTSSTWPHSDFSRYPNCGGCSSTEKTVAGSWVWVILGLCWVCERVPERKEEREGNNKKCKKIEYFIE